MNHSFPIGQGVFLFARACARIVTIASLVLPLHAADKEIQKSIQNLRSNDLKTKYAALENLKPSKSPETTDALVGALAREKDTRFRLTVLDQLAAQGQTNAVIQIAPFLKDKVVAVRQRTARVIGMLGGPQAERALSGALANEVDANVKAALLQGLSLCGSAQSMDQIQAALGDKHPKVQSNAKHALKRIGKSPSQKANKQK